MQTPLGFVFNFTVLFRLANLSVCLRSNLDTSFCGLILSFVRVNGAVMACKLRARDSSIYSQPFVLFSYRVDQQNASIEISYWNLLGVANPLNRRRPQYRCRSLARLSASHSVWMINYSEILLQRRHSHEHVSLTTRHNHSCSGFFTYGLSNDTKTILLQIMVRKMVEPEKLRREGENNRITRNGSQFLRY